MKKTGFTLIELLAVIVILAIILAIAVPGISNLITGATKNAFESDVKMLIKAIDYKLMADESLDIATINETNVDQKLGVGKDNYASLSFTRIDGKIHAEVIGKNKWKNLVATGTINYVLVVNSETYEEDPGAPGAITSPTGTILRGSEVTVSWGATTFWGVPDTSKTYRLEVQYNGGIWDVVASTGETTNYSHTVSSDINNTTIRYRVRTESDSGVSTWTYSSVMDVKDVIQILIDEQGFIPIASASELNNIRSATANTFGAGTQWSGTFTGGVDKKYIQVANISLTGYATGEGWTPIGDSTTPFIGTFDGNGYTISSLTINRPAGDFQGLFGALSGTNALIDNVTLDTVSVKGAQFTGSLIGRMLNGSKVTNTRVVSGAVTSYWASGGGLIGQSWGETNTVEDCHSGVSVLGDDTGNTIMNMGGLIGWNTGSIIDSSATGSVVSEGREVGGLVGTNSGLIQNSYASGSVQGASVSVGGLAGANDGGTIISSRATGNVTATTQYGLFVGGLVGINSDDSPGEIGRIENSYATGSVTATITGAEYVGGLVGANVYGSTIVNCYAIGAVNGYQWEGGLVGAAEFKDEMIAQGGAVTNSYWNTQTTGVATSEGGTGKTTVQMTYPQDSGTYVGWNFTDIWGINSGTNNGYPYLRALQ